jgi:hypothetical protein
VKEAIHLSELEKYCLEQINGELAKEAENERLKV